MSGAINLGYKNFRGFLTKHRLSSADAARQLHVSRASITHWRTQPPNALRRRAIEKWTSGQVREEHWETPNEREYLASIVPFPAAVRRAA